MTFFSWSAMNGTAGLRFHGDRESARRRASDELSVATRTHAATRTKAGKLTGSSQEELDWRARGICYGEVLGRSIKSEDGYTLEEISE